jgi:hypothetical protein
VQACFRGPRLYDTDQTRDLVNKWVAFFKKHRAILESDLIHLRRPDGRDWDGWLHVSAHLPERALAMLYNPLEEPVQRRINVPLYYSGLTDRAVLHWADGRAETMKLNRDYSVDVPVAIPARSRVWFTVSDPDQKAPGKH